MRVRRVEWRGRGLEEDPSEDVGPSSDGDGADQEQIIQRTDVVAITPFGCRGPLSGRAIDLPSWARSAGDPIWAVP